MGTNKNSQSDNAATRGKSIDKKAFAARFKKAREKKNLSITSLAKKTGLSRNSITDYEKEDDEKLPSLENATTIVKVLGVSLDWLAGIEVQSDLAHITKETFLAAFVAADENMTTELLTDTGEHDFKEFFDSVLKNCDFSENIKEEFLENLTMQFETSYSNEEETEDLGGEFFYAKVTIRNPAVAGFFKAYKALRTLKKSGAFDVDVDTQIYKNLVQGLVTQYAANIKWGNERTDS